MAGSCDVVMISGDSGDGDNGGEREVGTIREEDEDRETGEIGIREEEKERVEEKRGKGEDREARTVKRM